MQEAALFEQLVTKLRLKSEMTEVLVCLDEYVGSFFAPLPLTDGEHVFDRLPNDLAVILKEAFLKQPITPENQGHVQKIIDELNTKLHTLKIVQLTIAFQPDDAAISVFSEWVKKNVGPDTLLDLQFDKTIVGGALLVANGAYKDYSVRKNLASRFQIQRDEILGLLT